MTEKLQKSFPSHYRSSYCVQQIFAFSISFVLFKMGTFDMSHMTASAVDKTLFDGTVRPLLSAVLGRTKFWSQKPRINEVRG